MSHVKIDRIQQVLKYEQRVLDDLAQMLSQEVNKLHKIQKQIDANSEHRKLAIQTSERAKFTISTAQSRIQFTNQLEKFGDQLRLLKKKQQQTLDDARSEVAAQRARVKAIEALVKKMKHQAAQAQLNFEYNELYDNILSKSLEQKS